MSIVILFKRLWKLDISLPTVCRWLVGKKIVEEEGPSSAEESASLGQDSRVDCLRALSKHGKGVVYVK